MPISSITIKNVASYNDNGVTINNLKKLNFFVGSNGSGKSTIAKCIYNYSRPANYQDPMFQDCSILGVNHSQESILVYDEGFKQSNFIDSDKMRGVFSLNSTNAEIDASIKKIEAEISSLNQEKEKLLNREKDSKAKEQSIRTTVVNNCFDIRRSLQSFSKVKLQYSGSKEGHFEHLMAINLDNPDKITFENLQERYKHLYENEHIQIDHNIDLLLWEEVKHAEEHLETWLNKIIVGHDAIEVSNLIQELNMSSWVESGRQYLDSSGDICPFCQQPLPDRQHLIDNLNSFFDETYKKNIQSLKDAGNRYYQAIENLKKVIKSLQEYKPLTQSCYQFTASLSNPVGKTLDIVKEKIAKPNECKNIISALDLYHFVEKINSIITENNSRVANLSILKKEWEEDCWRWMKQESSDLIQKYLAKKTYFENKINPAYLLHHQVLDSKLSYNSNKISELRKLTVNTKEAVSAINLILQNVGFKDFLIEEVPSTSVSTQYTLKRQSNSSQTNVYKSLSEGEKTFISFLYFYQLCIGTDNPSNRSLKKIIVIDDPISSLDNHILFIVASIIHKLDLQKSKTDKNIFKDLNISQIIILTHNLYFYKEISFDRRPMCQNYMHYRVYKNLQGLSTVESSTKAYPTDDYSLLWGTIKENQNSTGVNESLNIMLCNVMRRIIDSYMNFTGVRNGNPTWASINSLDAANPIYLVASSFISQINDDSHGVSPLDSSYYGNIVRHDTSILYNAFKLVFDEIGPEHYTLMMNQ